MPEADKFKVAFAGVASIGFMNVSLSLNSVGFYQVTALSHIHSLANPLPTHSLSLALFQ